MIKRTLLAALAIALVALPTTALAQERAIPDLPFHPNGGPEAYAIDIKRLDIVNEDAGVVCLKIADEWPEDTWGDNFEQFTVSRHYTKDEFLILLSICRYYLRGRVDGQRALDK